MAVGGVRYCKQHNRPSEKETLIMKILGISGSQRPDETSGVHMLVRTVLENTGCDYELVSLRGKNISGCSACLGCVEDNVCKIRDDAEPLRARILAADAYVIGAPNFFSTLNATTHAFLERWYQFRHQTADALWGKLAVVVGVGGDDGAPAAGPIEMFMLYSFIETVAKVTGQGAACCFTCGYGETCDVGAIRMMHGPDFKITPETTPSVAKQPDVMQAAADAGKLLGQRLTTGHDRAEVTKKVQKMMMDLFASST
ncbi:MAG: flavodoxin family protein [Phycisphaerae bacterium]|jgi:multimeric flavodoxin WrbA|nr:flavodoxin family protein [Phycisphaerae bacterium]